MSQSEVEIRYKFVFSNGTQREYSVRIDSTTGMGTSSYPATHADWIQLDVCKCSHCPLKSGPKEVCPPAAGLEQAILAFKDEVSHQTVEVRVETAERTYSKVLSLQEGLLGLFGLIMATSRCPHMSFLRPMARFHLPFSTVDETIVRSTAFYLLKQMILHKTGKTPDWDLKGFSEAYERVQIVNQGIISRIRKMKTKGDADQNAIVLLDSFAALLNMELSQDFQSYKNIFLTDQ